MNKEKINKSEIAYKLLTPLMRLIFRLYYNPKILNKKNIPKEGPIIIVCNHKHVFDQCFAIMSTRRPIHYLAKKEYFDGKLSWFFKMFGCIPVNRDIHDTKAKESAIHFLKNGKAIGLFPEGTRNKTNDIFLLPLKFGAVSMAQKTSAYIVPCALTGDYKFQSRNLMLRFGKPIKITKEMNLEEQNNKLAKQIEKLMKENLKATNRTEEDELNSRCQDIKKSPKNR